MEHKCDKCGQMAALPNRENIPCIRGACNGKMKPLKEKEAHLSVSSSAGLDGPIVKEGDMEDYLITEKTIKKLEKDLIENPLPVEEVIAYNMNQLKDAAAKVGFPCIVRATTQEDFKAV